MSRYRYIYYIDKEEKIKNMENKNKKNQIMIKEVSK